MRNAELFGSWETEDGKNEMKLPAAELRGILLIKKILCLPEYPEFTKQKPA